MFWGSVFGTVRHLICALFLLTAGLAQQEPEPELVREIVTAITALGAVFAPCPPVELDRDFGFLCARLSDSPLIFEFLGAIDQVIADYRVPGGLFTWDWYQIDGVWEKEIRLAVSAAIFTIGIFEDRFFYIFWVGAPP